MSESPPDTVNGGSEQYEIRPYDPADRADVLSLFETVWGTDRGEDWLIESYERNPYLNGSPMVVADAGDEVVGARPFVPFPMRAGSTAFTAVLLNNAMVHPAHRRRGLFTRMMEQTLQSFEPDEATFLFNFANEKSAPGYRGLGFKAVGTGPRKLLRLQRPGRYIRDRVDVPFSRALGTVADATIQSYHRLKRLRAPEASRWRVERRVGIPARELTRLYENRTPDQLHTRREEPLYRWLESDPYWEYETYLASTGASPAAAIVVRSRPDSVPEIVDAVPAASSAGQAAFPTLLDAALATHGTAPSISVTGPVVNERLFPPELLSRFGFHSPQGPLLSRFTRDEDTTFVYVVKDDADHFEALGLMAPENWLVQVH